MVRPWHRASSDKSRSIATASDDAGKAAHEDEPPPFRGEFAVGEEFNHLRQHFGAVAAVQRQRELRDQ